MLSGIIGIIIIATTPRPSHNLRRKVSANGIIEARASELAQDFNYNSDLAMAHYGGHDLLVTGRVANVNPLILEGHHPYAPVRVVFNKGYEASVSVAEGKMIELSCHSVRNHISYLTLSGCG